MTMKAGPQGPCHRSRFLNQVAAALRFLPGAQEESMRRGRWGSGRWRCNKWAGRGKQGEVQGQYDHPLLSLTHTHTRSMTTPIPRKATLCCLKPQKHPPAPTPTTRTTPTPTPPETPDRSVPRSSWSTLTPVRRLSWWPSTAPRCQSSRWWCRTSSARTSSGSWREGGWAC